MIENYQTKILEPSEIVDYSSEMIRCYRAENIQAEPMIGFKILLKDLNASVMTQQDRFAQIESTFRVLQGTGCILRESHPSESPVGFWLITFPVAQSQIARQLNNLMGVLQFFATQLGIVNTELIEICVSGRCGLAETESRLGMICIPPQYQHALCMPDNTPYKLGHIVRINDNFVMLRTRWDWSSQRMQTGRVNNHHADLMIIPQLLTAMFH